MIPSSTAPRRRPIPSAASPTRVLDEAREWRNRPLDPVYPVVFFDALRVKIRDEGLVRNKAVYVARALNPDGEEVLGLWIEPSEGAKFRLKAVNKLKARGVNDILIAVVDGLKGFPEAIGSVCPATVVQTCIVRLIRNSLAFASWTDRKPSPPAVKAIYRAENADIALARLEAFEAEWGKRCPCATLPSARSGAGPGSRSSRSSRSPPPFAR